MLGDLFPHHGHFLNSVAGGLNDRSGRVVGLAAVDGARLLFEQVLGPECGTGLDKGKNVLFCYAAADARTGNAADVDAVFFSYIADERARFCPAEFVDICRTAVRSGIATPAVAASAFGAATGGSALPAPRPVLEHRWLRPSFRRGDDRADLDRFAFLSKYL